MLGLRPSDEPLRGVMCSLRERVFTDTLCLLGKYRLEFLGEGPQKLAGAIAQNCQRKKQRLRSVGSEALRLEIYFVLNPSSKVFEEGLGGTFSKKFLPKTKNQKPKTKNHEARTIYQEPRTIYQEQRTKYQKPKTKNQEPRTKNKKLKTKNKEPRTKNQ